MTSLFISKLVCCTNLRSVAICKLPKSVVYRKFSNDVRESARRARQKTLREQAMAPAGEGSFKVGKGALAGAAAVGVGALCYYGLGLSDEAGAAEKSLLWPDYVKTRIRTAYFYFGSSLVVTATSAMAAFRSPAIMNIVTKNGFLGLAISIGAIMGTGMLARSIPYKEGFGNKQMAWLLHAGTLGAMLAPMCYLGGPILIRAAWYTAGIVGGLSTIAMCAPSEKFLTMGAPLGMGLGVVFASSIGSMFLPPTSALGVGLYSISLYGGLLLFSAFMLYDTQRIIAQAERYPTQAYNIQPYDPINAAMSVYLDTINIFVRIATILAGGGNRRKLWPDYVKKRIRATYFYFGSSLIVTAASALVTFNSTSTIQLLIGSGVLNMLGTFGFVMLTGMIAQKIRYKEGFGIKQMAWLLHVGTVGTMLAPLCFLGGPVLVQTALYSAGVIGGLTIVAVCAPGRKFLSLGAPLGMGLGVVIASSIGSFFFPRSTTLGSRFYFVGVYGGLALFSLLVLYDTQHIILLAEKYPVNYRDYDIPPYDPINAAMTIYSDALNIFSNILTILLENDSKKRST